MSAFRKTDDGIEFRLKVVPGASRSKIVGWLGDSLKIQVSAPPERQKANAAVEKLIADALKIPESAVAVIGGKTSPRKVVRVQGLTLSEANERLGQ